MNTIFGSLTDRDSILANKQGTLTDMQRDLLHLTSGLTFWYALGSVVVIIGIVAWAMTKQMTNLPANAPRIPAYFWIVLAIVIGAPLLYLGWQMVRSSRITHEIASGEIPSEEGRVEWTGGRYRVAASVNGLRSIYGPINAMPGRYQFYLLPGSRYLLSADPLDTPQMSRAALTDVLGQVLGFTKDDLAANREGRITPAQTTRLRERHDRIAFVQGPGKKNFRYLTRSVIKSYLVNDERFDVSARAYDAMVEGETYRVYYTPLTKTILSIEAIPPNSPPPSS